MDQKVLTINQIILHQKRDSEFPDYVFIPLSVLKCF